MLIHAFPNAPVHIWIHEALYISIHAHLTVLHFEDEQIQDAAEEGQAAIDAYITTHKNE